MTILAAIDDSPVAGPVLEVARRIASFFGTSVESIHVRHGDVVSALRAEAEKCDAVALVIGTRGVTEGATPAGQIALDLVQSLDRPVVVVPPHAADRPLRRVLVAVEGDGQSHALTGLYARLGNRPIPELIVLHVIEPSELPPFADSPVLEAEAFEREFMIRVSRNVVADPSLVRFEARVGDAPKAVREAARELDVDLVVMAWHRNLSGGHGRLVREMLAGAAVPMALLPLDDRGRPARSVA